MIQYGLFRIENAVISENMNKRRDRTVLAFRASEAVNSRRHFEGVFRYAREHGWNVHAFEYGGRQGDPLEWKDPESGLRTGLKELLDFWRPEGCVVDCGAVERPLPPEAFGRIPVVFLDLYGDGGHSAAAAISSDDKGIASVAACELLKLGLSDCAFVPPMRDYPWSEARRKEFVRLVRMNRRTAHVFDCGGAPNIQVADWRERLGRWLATLPKPCGVFAACDLVGAAVLDLCRAGCIDVPTEIAVVGVDDDQQICENTVPTLTSIRQDYEEGGYLVCGMLDKMMAKSMPRPQRLHYGIAAVIRRASSCSCGDRRVLKAIEHIRLHACERISLDDIAREMGCSRRLATRLFRQHQRQSILDGIHEERIKRVKMFLANPRHDMKSLPDLCGYKSLVDLRRVFKARTGETIGEFMRRTICLLLVLVGISGFAAADFYRVEKGSDDWAVVDASGRSELLLGVDQVRWDGMPCERMGWRRPYEEHNAAHYGSRREWEDETLARLKSWGFNMLGACCDDSLRHRGLAHSIFLNMSEGFCTGDEDRWISEYKGVPNTAMPNVFHPDYAAYCDAAAREMCEASRNDVDLLGYYIDNELVWQGKRGAPKETGFFDTVRGKGEGHSARRKLMEFLRERGIDGWVSFDALPFARQKELKAAFLDFAAERYFRVTTEAIRRHDPNHLILGCRFAGLDGAPVALWKAAGRFCDVITFNCYPWADIDRNVVLDAKGGVSLVSRLADVYALTGKPLLVTEWSFPALDTGRPCLNGAGQRFKTQAERVEASALFARTLLSLPYVLGYSYFMWIDQPALGTNGEKPEDSNYGLVSEEGVPYAGLTEMFARLHKEVRDGVRRPSMPQPKEPPRMTERSTAEIFRSEATGNPKDIRFIHNGADWELANSRGLSLRGKIGGTNMVDKVVVDSRFCGRYNGMIQLIATNGVSHWVLGDCVKSVKFGQTGMCGSILITATGRTEEHSFVLEHRITVAPDRKDFLCEVVGLENTGCSPFSVKRFYMCPFAAEDRPSVKRGVPNVWKGGRECYWKMSGGRLYGMVSSDISAERFKFHVDAYGCQHPDTCFILEVAVELAPGERHTPSTPMSARCVVSREASLPQ